MKRTLKRPDAATLVLAAGALGAAFLAVPLVATLILSFSGQDYLGWPDGNWSLRWYRRVWDNSSWSRPLETSLKIAVLTATGAVALGTAGAIGVRRLHGVTRFLAIAVFLAPVVTPTVVFAVGFAQIFSRVGVMDTAFALVISHTLLATPYAFLMMTAAYSRANTQLETAAVSLGATRLTAFVTVMLPQLRGGLAVSWLLAFIVSFDEPVLSLFLTSFRTRTLPRQILDGIRFDLDPTATAVAGVMILATITLGLLTLRSTAADRRRP